MTQDEYAERIRQSIEAAEAAGYVVEVQAKGYPDPTEERLVVAKQGSGFAEAWHWNYSDESEDEG